MDRRNKTYSIKALLIAAFATIVIILLVLVGSRQLQNFDAALITYLFGMLFATFGIVYRASVWLQRPPTWLYFKRGLYFFFTGKLLVHFVFVAKELVGNIFLQKFIYRRGKYRWLAHFMMASGCMIAFSITIPLTFGWIHFTLKEGTNDLYQAHFFGFSAFDFRLGTIVAFFVFHILVWSSFLVIFGCAYYIRRRLTNPGLIAIQLFDSDLLPLILLIAVAVTGLGISYSYSFMDGLAFDFMAVLHAVTVILFLIWIPFGKFFHIIQRPAQIGAHLYRLEGMKKGMAKCPYTGEEFTSKLHIDDLKMVSKQLGFDFTLKDGTSHLDLSPEGKRSRFAQAHLRAKQEGESLFG